MAEAADTESKSEANQIESEIYFDDKQQAESEIYYDNTQYLWFRDSDWIIIAHGKVRPELF